MKGTTIRHMVIFTLKHAKGSAEETAFLEDGGRLLSSIPQVRNLEVLDQVSQKCDYRFGFSMEFDNADDYVAYNDHPIHVAFVNERWLKEVERFQEIDFKAV